MTTTTATTATRPTEVECPTCHAAAGESCHVRKAWVCGQSTTRKGEPRAPHAARVAAARQLDAEQPVTPTEAAVRDRAVELLVEDGRTLAEALDAPSWVWQEAVATARVELSIPRTPVSARVLSEDEKLAVVRSEAFRSEVQDTLTRTVVVEPASQQLREAQCEWSHPVTIEGRTEEVRCGAQATTWVEESSECVWALCDRHADSWQEQWEADAEASVVEAWERANTAPEASAPKLLWRRVCAGVYRATTSAGVFTVQRVTLDDGEWWIVVYPDGSSGDPTQYLATAKAWAEAEAR